MHFKQVFPIPNKNFKIEIDGPGLIKKKIDNVYTSLLS